MQENGHLKKMSFFLISSSKTFPNSEAEIKKESGANWQNNFIFNLIKNTSEPLSNAENAGLTTSTLAKAKNNGNSKKILF